MNVIEISDSSSSDGNATSKLTHFEQILQNYQDQHNHEFRIDDGNDDFESMLSALDNEPVEEVFQEDENKNHFLDMTHWPTVVKNFDDALRIYNDIGLCKKVQFKKMNCQRYDSGIMRSFTI